MDYKIGEMYKFRIHANGLESLYHGEIISVDYDDKKLMFVDKYNRKYVFHFDDIRRAVQINLELDK